MKRRRLARRFSIIATILMVFSLFIPAFAGAQPNASPHTSLVNSKEVVKAKMANDLMSDFEKDEEVTFLIKFKEKADPMKIAKESLAKAQNAKLSAYNQELVQRSAVISELKATAISSQQNVTKYLEEEVKNGNAKDIKEFYVVNGMAVTATKEVAEKIASFPEVEKILPNEKRQLFKGFAAEEAPKAQPQNIEWSVDRVNAPAVWGLGIDGAGTVVANIDTGVEWEHPALKEKYRGYNAATGAVDHTYSFFDPVNGQTSPYDIDGHGTHTMGTMVGSEPNGANQVGVAPGAKWIAVQAFTADGAYDADLLAAADWIMEPGGDYTKAPDVVNNSWGGGSGIDEWYQDVVIGWRAAGIFPAFAAGNTTLFNPGGPGSVATPANYPESFAVGATDSNDMLANFSLRGPSPYGEIKPEVSAPGVAVRSSVPGGSYASYNGTSMATPAVAGVVALLRSANSSLSVDDIEQLLIDTANPRTDAEYPESPNNGYGHGIVDAFAAVSTVADGLGSVQGQVTMDGEDTEAPVFEHVAPTETYAGLDLELSVSVSDNVSITSVQLQVGDQLLDAKRVSGNFKAGDYEITVPADMLEVGTFTYNWVINDFGNNEVSSDEYNIEVKPGITNGYFDDFEANPVGWQHLGSNNVWEWGTPESGPGEAYSGENLFATNLAGPYASSMDAHLVMPPIDVPADEDSYLQFKSWHNFEISSTGRAYDYGNLVISTDLENWTTLDEFVGASNGWSNIEADLRDYQGQRVYIGFYTYSDGSVTRDGWYIDDVALTNASQYSNDEVPPTFEHTPPGLAYQGMPLSISVTVQDDLLVGGATLNFLDGNGEWQELEAELESGSDLEGSFSVLVPGEHLSGDTFTYKWVVSDYAGNTVESEEYSLTLSDGISVGYSEDFENNPQGWNLIGGNNVWALGEPTSGPNEAVSGVNVYATNLGGEYPASMDGTLVMPVVSIPEEGAFLQFKSWHEFEQSSTGRAWDYGQVVISTDMVEWATVAEFHGSAMEWQDAEVNLSDYAGQSVYVGFYGYSDGSVSKLGWYIDDVALSDTSLNLANNPASSKISKQDDAAEKEKEAALEKSSDSKNIVAQPTKEDAASLNPAANQVSGLPLGATVSVLENGRSVSTNPQDGSYALTLPSGDYTLVAETYGFASQQQSVTVVEDETATANFVLEELPKATVSGTVTSEKSGNPIAGATLLLVEDANVEPVQTDENGNFSITAYEGTYTIKVLAQDYYGQELEVTFDEDKSLDIALEPFFSIPGGEIGYDDGTAENARAFYDAGNGWAVKMSLPEGKEQAIVTDGVFQFHGTDWPVPGGTGFAVEVWSAGEDGMPGEKLAGPIEAEAIRDLNQPTVVDLSEHNIQVNGDFYMVYIQTIANPNAPGLATDESSANAGRSYQLVGGAWSKSPTAEGNYMIRARVAYGVGDPVITSPTNGEFTNEAAVTVEGTASHSTTLSLLNNGAEVGTADVGDDGAFSFDIELAEGENELQAVTMVNGEEATESETVTVTLDTIAPEVTLANLKDGDRTNRETLTVQGTVADVNLASLTVNGQEASVEAGLFSKRILLDEGENTIEVVATDAAGNVTTKVVTVEADFTAPEIENVTPTEDKELQAGETVMITFDSESGLDTSFVVHMPLTNMKTSNVTELPMVETTEGHYVAYWTVPGGIEAEGAVIEVIAADDFGNESRAQATGKLNITDGSGDEEDNHPGKGKGKDKGNNGPGNGKGKAKGKN
ncbi:S8 family peptidase [Paucisalibacillus sp. EB02]|uniref:S8 family peptidase n=1 Tax=Paucisalibacillus sp. EB02 TaxID=1347087 RepID=UPI00069415C8|nr:S8 family peptidase [Paucisalibacillus sp. EB02]